MLPMQEDSHLILTGIVPRGGGGGAVATEKGGGHRSECSAGYQRSTVPKHSIYQSEIPNNYFGLNAMNNLQKSISGETPPSPNPPSCLLVS
jgi:hypothetical protein